MTELTPDTWQRLSEHLDHALELPEASRAAWLAELAASDAEIAGLVTTALAVREREAYEGFLAQHPPLPIADATAATLIGRRVGPYVIEAELGRGGMGSVWRASRSDGRYTAAVAVKFLHAAWIGQAGAQRFQTEGSLLGRLDHPNIARLLDAGLYEGTQPFLILEYVEGEPIDQYCARHALGLEARARLFLDVLAAVSHAHRQLIVHRDIKPANVFVTRDGVVKLLDFGIAKLLGEDGGALTRSSASALTPQYAAPEQLLGRPVSTATDVYSLGVVLYQLLTGAHPVGADATSSVDLVQAIVSVAPRRASAAATLTAVDPRALVGDLDNILGKALKKEPAERYGTVEAFGDDLRRYLTHEPVQAHPDTLSYRAGKFVRRHRGSMLSALLTLLALLATTGFALWQARAARLERDTALAAARRADAVGDFMTRLLGDVSDGASPQDLRRRLDRARALLDKEHYDDPLVKVNLLRYIAGLYTEDGDSASAVQMYEQALAAVRTTDDRIAEAQVGCSLANYYDGLGRNDDSERRIRESMAVLDRLGSAVRPQVRAECELVESYVATSRGEHRRAVAAAATALAEVEAAGIRFDLEHDTVVNALARANARAGHNRVAVELIRQLRRSDATQGRDQTIAGWIHAYHEAHDVLAGGRVREADTLTEALVAASRRYRPEGGVDLDAAVIRAQALLALARPAEAEALLAPAVAGASGDAPDALGAALWHAEALAAAGRAREAAQVLERHRAAVEAAIATRAALAPLALRVRARLQLAAGDPAEAARTLDAAAALAVDADQEPTTERRPVEVLRAEAALARGAVEPACRAAESALALARREAIDPESSAWVGEALLLQARCEQARSRPDAARIDARAALRQLEVNLGPDHPLAVQARAIGT